MIECVKNYAGFTVGNIYDVEEQTTFGFKLIDDYGNKRYLSHLFMGQEFNNVEA
jgi:hypothetical protein